MPSPLTLTFDDGPDERWTPLVLSALAASETHATFFMIGERAARSPGTVHAVLEAGPEVQLHCHRHLRHTELSESEVEGDTLRALAVFEELGVKPTSWRVPWGISTPASTRVAERNQLSLVRWTIDTHDWRGDLASDMLRGACAQMRDGGIVLMHDALGPGSRREGCENTVALIGRLVAAAGSQGLQLQTLGSLPQTPPGAYATATPLHGRG